MCDKVEWFFVCYSNSYEKYFDGFWGSVDRMVNVDFSFVWELVGEGEDKRDDKEVWLVFLIFWVLWWI